MKKRKDIKRIFNVFLSFILIFFFFCGDLQVYADNTSVTVINYTGYSSGFFTLKLLAPIDSGIGLVSSFGVAQTVDISSDTVYFFNVTYRHISGGSAYYYYFKVYYNNTLLSTSATNPTVIDFDSSLTFTVGSSYSYSSTNYYVTFANVATPTPEPTPTPTPAPTPTPLPVDYDDTQFWGRMNDMAEGGWSAITATFNGIFNDTVFRNLVVYVPLFGAIIYLFVYLLFMGSD